MVERKMIKGLDLWQSVPRMCIRMRLCSLLRWPMYPWRASVCKGSYRHSAPLRLVRRRIAGLTSGLLMYANRRQRQRVIKISISVRIMAMRVKM